MEHTGTKIKKYIVLFLLMGDIYYVLEGFWRGWSNIIMLFIGGLCGLIIGLINEKTKLKIWQQCLIDTIIIICIEFIFGVILNRWLRLEIWNYDKLCGNILGQICLPYSILWFFLIPVAIWFYNWLKYRLYNEKESERLIEIYIKLVTNK
ncbi:MAG: putative ABC transporter permease [Vallitalea sp.]|jgi:uncharacterized membrane protein|nr:putative ABC transporter permease [Vallitalea sp.]